MKKIILSASLLLSMFMLSSCKVNWFGETIDVPWYFVAIPFTVIIVASYLILINKTYICPNCGAEFKPRWYQLYVGVHMGNKRIAKCPYCGEKGWCKIKR